MENKEKSLLTFVEYTEFKKSSSGKTIKRANYRCICGDINNHLVNSVLYGKAKMCLKCSYVLRGENKKTHGLTGHELYKKWSGMKKRCYNKKCERYKNYGGLGIKVCEDWKKNFINFYNWSLDNGWREGLSLERKNVLSDYSPENCCYIPLREQHFNKKNTFHVLSGDSKICLSDFLINNDIYDLYHKVWFALSTGKTPHEMEKRFGIRIEKAP